MTRIERIIEFLNQQPKDNFLRHALALEYIKLGEEQKAQDLFIAILTDAPDYIGSYYHLGKCLERMNDKEAAIKWQLQKRPKTIMPIVNCRRLMRIWCIN